MSTFIVFVKKETLHLLRDTRTMMIALLMPMALVLLFGFAISTELRNVNFAVAAPDFSESLRKDIMKLSSGETMSYVGMVPLTEAEPVLRSGKADAVLVYDSDGNVQVMVDASNPNDAVTIPAYISGILSGSGSGMPSPETHLLFNPQMQSSYNFVPGILGIILILISAILTSVSIVREKETGTMELLLVSPVKPANIIIGKMVPYFVLSCVDLIAVLLLAKFVLGVPMTGSIVATVGVSMLYLALSLSLGLLISCFAKTQVTALIVSAFMLLVPIMMLSGMLFDVSNMPLVFRWISKIIPATWYIDAMKKLMVQGTPFIMVLKNTLILAGMTGFIMIVALKKFSDRLE